MQEPSLRHAALMDMIYRRQRLIYDTTRAYYLLGRDRAIEGLAPPEGGRVLEIACGTGRNLRKIAQRYPGRRLHGLDISEQMLRTARKKLKGSARLAQGDARDFEPDALFGCPEFDRILLSYAVSMIPDWQRAVASAARHLAPGGTLHIVDFHDQAGLPAPFRRLLWAWLARFHVTPRTDLSRIAADVAEEIGGTATHQSLFRGYAQHVIITGPASS